MNATGQEVEELIKNNKIVFIKPKKSKQPKQPSIIFEVIKMIMLNVALYYLVSGLILLIVFMLA